MKRSIATSLASGILASSFLWGAPFVGAEEADAVPCNQLQNKEKRHECILEVRETCKEEHPEGGRELGQCLRKGLAGGKFSMQRVMRDRRQYRQNIIAERMEQRRRGMRAQERARGRLSRGRAVQQGTPGRVIGESFITPHARGLQSQRRRSRRFIQSGAIPDSTPIIGETSCERPEQKNCREECGGLPSYPFFEFEKCMKTCGKEIKAEWIEFNACLKGEVEEEEEEPHSAPDGATRGEEEENGDE